MITPDISHAISAMRSAICELEELEQKLDVIDCEIEGEEIRAQERAKKKRKLESDKRSASQIIEDMSENINAIDTARRLSMRTNSDSRVVLVAVKALEDDISALLARLGINEDD